MAAPCRRSASVCRAAAMLGAAAALTGCVSGPATSTPGPGGALFRTRISDVSGRISPGPNAVWYVQREPLGFQKVGFAAWGPRAPHPLRAWLDRMLHRHAAAEAEASAFAAANLPLPTPSRVQVTNLVNGATITVRVEDRTPMSGAVIRLPTEAARRLGADPARPLLVRIRYLAPVVAYRSRPALRYALRRPATPPIAVAQAPVPVTHAAPPAPAALIRVAAIQATTAPLQPPALALRPEQPVPRPGARSLQIQAGAFASLANARRAQALLQPVAATVIAPVRRGEITLYRVVVEAPAEPAEVAQLRARMSRAGFPDARLVRPL